MSQTEKFIEEFKSKTTNFQRFETFWNFSSSLINEECDALFANSNSVNTNKDSAKAANLRIDGKKLFENLQFNDAILKYNESLRHSVFNDENMALTYADRATAFFELKEFQLCSNDIDLALQSNCPKELVVELKERKLQCIHRSSLSEHTVEFSHLDSESKEATSNDNKIESLVKGSETKIRLPFKVNKLIPSASAKITFDSSTSKGKIR